MACACKVNKQISYLQKKYGYNTPKSKTSNIRGKIEIKIKQILLFFFVLLLLPIELFGIIFHFFINKGKPIQIDKVFRLKAN